MVEIKMLVNFRGRETGEILLQKGRKLEVNEKLADYLFLHEKARLAKADDKDKPDKPDEG